MEYFDSMEFDRSPNLSSRAVPNWLTCAPSILPFSFDKWVEREAQSDKTWLSEIEECPDRLAGGADLRPRCEQTPAWALASLLVLAAPNAAGPPPLSLAEPGGNCHCCVCWRPSGACSSGFMSQ